MEQVLEPASKQRRKRVNYVLAATLVAQGITLADAAKETGAKNANVLAVGLRRKGVTATIARAIEPTPNHIKTITAKVANQASELLRTRFSRTLDKHAEALEQVETKPDLDHIQRVGQALEPLARTAKIVHDWGNETKLGLVALGVVEQLDQAQDVIDIGSSSEVSTEPKQIETPGGS